MRYEGKTAIITGAAGGIGRAACLRFASEGARIVAVDLPNSALDEVVSEVKTAGAEAIAVPCDSQSGSELRAGREGHLRPINAFFNKPASKAGSARASTTRRMSTACSR
jgi:NAD(P)-dependent dehydrogenase (short-subunit alcohol dehydrogenase family)